MAELANLRAIVRGRVQGVFFRESTRRRAEQLGLVGYVRNLPDRTAVEVVAEGEKQKLGELLDFLGIGPPAAKVESVETKWGPFTGKHAGFETRF